MHLDIPDLRTIVRHALPRVVESTLVPLAILLVTLRTLGVRGAMLAGLVWVFGMIGVRLLLRRRVPGILLVGAATLSARTAVSFLTGSTIVYFLQPSLGTALVATAFLVSVPLGRPLAAKLAADFCPLPDDLYANEHVQRFFRRISLLWAFVQAANATVAIWLLLTQSLATFVLARFALSWGITIGAIAISALWFRASMARHDIHVRLPSWRRRAVV